MPWSLPEESDSSKDSTMSQAGGCSELPMEMPGVILGAHHSGD